jgi:DNA-binding GntR family transcriptional regulator
MNTPLPPKSLKQSAYEIIKHKIVSLEIPPGTFVNEKDLQDELGFGRTPIREALQQLAMEKLVNIVSRRGILVTDIKITDLQRLFEVRLPLESLAVRQAAARGREEHWRRMDAILAELPSNGQAADNNALIEIDKQWHETLYEAANNVFLQDTLVTLYALSLRLWYYAISDIGDMAAAVKEHQQILDALKAGDVDRAASALEAHIRAFQREIQTALLGKTTETID